MAIKPLVVVFCSLLFLLVAVRPSYAATLYWVGADGANGSVAANWSTTNPTSCSTGVTPSSAAPTSADTINFDADCDNGATIDSGFTSTVSAVVLTTGYSGTVTQAIPLTVNLTFTTSGGTWNSANQALTVTSTFTMNDGSVFTASSGNTTFNGNFTISGGTFNHNNGTVFFGGSGGTSNCNNIVFNLVVFNHSSSSVKTMTNCSLPVGVSPNISGGLVLNMSTLSGSGTVTFAGGATTSLNAGGSFSGFTGFVSTSGALIVAGGTADFSGYATFTLGQSLTLSSGSLSLPSGADLNSSLTISGGTFTAPSGTMTLAGALTISGSPTFNANGGTITFDGTTGAALSCNNVTFNLVTFANTTNTKTINSNCTLPVGNNPVLGIGGGVSVSGTLTGTGVLTNTGTLTLNTGAVLSGFSGLATNFLTVSGATTDLSSYSSFTSTSTTTVNSGSLTLPNTSTLSSLTITGGSFTASGGITTIGGNVTISGSPTFNANGGTVSFTGAGSAYTCNNVVFNLVTFNNSSTKTVNAGCTLPLGNNPVLLGSGGITLNGGSLTGSGIFTKTIGGPLTLNTGATLTGFNGISLVLLNVAGATADFASYNSFSASSNVTLTSGSLSLPSGADLNGALTISGGSFTAPSGTMTLAGNLTISGTPTFNANGGTIVFDGSSATLSCNNVSFSHVVVSNDMGIKTVSSNCSLPVGNNPQLGVVGSVGLVSIAGTLIGSGTISTTDITLTGSSAVLSGFTGLISAGRLVVSNGAVINMGSYSPVDVRRFFLITSSSVFTAPTGIMTVHDVWQQQAGAFNHNNGTVKFVGNTPSIFSGIGTTFYNLTRELTEDSPAASSMGFTTVGTQTIQGTLTLKGLPDNLLQIRSLLAGTKGKIDAQGGRVVQYLDVKDMSNLHGTAITALCSIDSGNTSGFLFPPCGGSVFHLVSPSDRSYTRDERPTFSWRPPSERSFFDAAKEYSLIIDNGVGSDFVVEGIPAGRQNGSNVYETEKFRVEYLNWDNEDLSDNLISLKTKSSASWPQDFNDGKLTEGKRNWRIQFKDSSNTIYEMSNELFVDFTPPTTNISKINTLNYVPAVLTSDTTPTIFGIVTDQLMGNTEDRKVAAGPKSIDITIEQSTESGYKKVLSDTIPLTKNYWQADSSEIVDNTKNTSDKFSSFEYTFTKPLAAGTYKITLTPRDQTDNAYASQIFQIHISNYSDVLGAMTEELQQTYQTQIAEKSELTIPDPNEDQEKIVEKFNQQLKQKTETPVGSLVRKNNKTGLILRAATLVAVPFFWFFLIWKRRKKKSKP